MEFNMKVFPAKSLVILLLGHDAVSVPGARAAKTRKTREPRDEPATDSRTRHAIMCIYLWFTL